MKKKLSVVLFILMFIPGVLQAKFNYVLWTCITVELGSVYMMSYHKDVPPNPYAATDWSYTEKYGNARIGSDDNGYWEVRGAGTVTNHNNYEWSKNSQFKVSFYDGEAKQKLLYSTDVTFRNPIEAGGVASWDTGNRVIWDNTNIKPEWGEITLVHAGSPYDYMDKDDGQLIRVTGAAIFIINTLIMIKTFHEDKMHADNDSVKLAFNCDMNSIKIGATKRF